jgi:hypothetical protein
MRVALVSHESRMRVALESQLVAYQLASNRLCGGFQMALGGFVRLFRTPHFAFRIRSRVFSISIPNLPPLARLPRDGLGELWHQPGTILYP